MTRSKRTAAPRASAADHLGKAEQFLDAARSTFDTGAFDAAMLNAIHAGISAADSVCVVLAGIRSADPDHVRAADLLEEVGQGVAAFRDKSKQLRQLVSKKTQVEYQGRRARAPDARDALRRAERLVGWAGEQVDAARGH